MKILINSMPNDAHTSIISTCLQNRGHTVYVMIGSDFPEKTSFSFVFDKNKTNLYFTDQDSQKVQLNEIDVVWHRRPIPFKIPKIISELDMIFARNENRSLAYSWMACLKNAFWINNPFAKERASSKPLQLQIAKETNLKIPKTYIGNNPEDIKSFINENNQVIYKPLNGYVWKEKRDTTTYTSIVTRDILPKDNILRATPGIFQTLVKKSFEVRAQFFGKSCFAIAIESNKLIDGDLDWRKDPNKGGYKSIELPEQVYNSCQKMLDKLGLVSGGFDFIVTPEGKWIFLEVNEAGQFLFIEHWCNELNLIEGFCDFIESKSRNFIYKPQSKTNEKLEKYYSNIK